MDINKLSNIEEFAYEIDVKIFDDEGDKYDKANLKKVDNQNTKGVANLKKEIFGEDIKTIGLSHQDNKAAN